MSITEYNGGSVIAMAGKECVAIASDLRLGAQAMTVACNFDKVIPITDRCFIGLPGLATDLETLKDRFKMQTHMYKMREEREIEPETFASLVSSTLYQHRFGPFFVQPVIAGLTRLPPDLPSRETDDENLSSTIDPYILQPGTRPRYRPFICAMDLIGCPNYARDFVVSGTASDKLFGMGEGVWEPDLEPEELFETISQALLSAQDRDALSGWGAVVRVITPDKVITRTLRGRMD